MRINHNLSSLNVANSLNATSLNLSKATEAMSTGSRINRAADDAAGLAISQKMRAQIRGLAQASRNAQDGISLIQTAEGALNETTNILQRMRELSIQAATDTNADEDRSALQKEMTQLTTEVNRIARTTEFNTRKILMYTGNPGGLPDPEPTPTPPGPTPPGPTPPGPTPPGPTPPGPTPPAPTPPAPTPPGPTPPGPTPPAPLTEKDKIVSNLKKWWLASAEKIVKDSFGIEASNINLNVKVYDDPTSSTAAFVKASYTQKPGDKVGLEGITGKGSNLSLEINLAASRPVDGSVDGGSYYQYVDRVITHEITHAVMSSTMNFGDLPIWFIEGTAEFSHGADERLKNAIAILGKGIDKASLDDGVKQVVDAIGDGGEAAWNGGNPPSYSAAYLSTRYLDHQIREAGGNGIRDITEYLAANPTKTLVDALDNASHGAFSSGGGKTSYEDFIAKFKADVTDWDSMVDKTGVKLDMGISDGRLENEKDTGSVLGSDVTGNPLNAKTAESIVPEPGGVGAAEVEQPMNGFKLFWPATTGGGISTPYRAAGKTASDPDEPLFQLKRNEFYLQIGANKSQGMAVYLNDMQADSLEIVGDKGGKIKLDSGTEVYLSTSDEARVTNGEDDEVVGYAVDIMSAKTASAAIEVFSQALNKVSLERSRLGAYQNRLEHTINNLNVAEENLQASESRISDADIAKMSLIFTKQNIKMQAAQSMLAQSNQQPQAVLQLLR